MKIFFSYFGSKGRMAKLYHPPAYNTIIEPFAGSAGYAIRYYYKNVLLYDLSPVVCGVWDYLINVDPSELRRLPILREDQTVDDIKGVPVEAKHFVGFWLTQSQTYPSKKCQTKSRGSGWTASIRNRTAEQVQFIRRWKVFCQSYETIDNREATWFIDPPYEKAGTRYKLGSELIDFNKLSIFCKARQGQVIVCEQKGAEWLPFETLIVERNASNKENHEVVWYKNSSKPAPSQPTLFDGAGCDYAP